MNLKVSTSKRLLYGDVWGLGFREGWHRPFTGGVQEGKELGRCGKTRDKGCVTSI